MERGGRRYYRRFALKAAIRVPNERTRDRREILETFPYAALRPFEQPREEEEGRDDRRGSSSIRWMEDNGIRRAVPIDRIDVRGPVSRPKGLFLPEGAREMLRQLGSIRTNTDNPARIYEYSTYTDDSRTKVIYIIALRGKIKGHAFDDWNSNGAAPFVHCGAAGRRGQTEKWNYGRI